MFEGIDENNVSPSLFSTTLRSLLVDNILNRIELHSLKLNHILKDLVLKYKLDELRHSEANNHLELNPDQGIKFIELKFYPHF